MKTLSKHTKYRIEDNEILICQCKELLDFKLDFKFLCALKKIDRGLKFSEVLSSEEKILYNELNKIKALVELKIKSLNQKNYSKAYKLLDKNLKLTRTKKFLVEKLKEYPQFFKGLYLDNELIGVIQGFPREDYILLSEIAVDERFRNRGFGHLLVKEFEKNVHGKIKVGAQENAVNFYKSLGYQPSIFIQVKKKNWDLSKLKGYRIIYQISFENIIGFEIECKEVNLDLLDQLNKKFNPISVQYLFTKVVE